VLYFLNLLTANITSLPIQNMLFCLVLNESYSPHTRQDRESLKKGRTLNSPSYDSESFGSHCRRERHADTYSEVAFTGFISATSVNSRTRGTG